MRKRLATTAALIAGLGAAGCGGGSGASDAALSFVPPDAPVIVTVDTDLEGEQLKQADELLGRFAFAGRVRSEIENAFDQSAEGLDFDEDVRPVLGNELVVAVPTVEGLQQDNSPVVLALEAEDEDKAQELVERDATRVGSAEGTDIYRSGDDTFVALQDGVIVAASTQEDLEAALERHAGDDQLTGDELEDRFAGLDGDGIMNVGVDAERLIAESPEAEPARAIPWVAGLRDVGFTLRAVDDGFESEFRLTTENVTEEQLPFASGAESGPVVRRAGDVGFGIRNPAQTWRFFESIGRVTDRKDFEEYERRKRRLNKQLRIDIDEDLIGQLDGAASVSVALNGGFAVRADLSDPAAFRRTLERAAPRLEEAFPGRNVAVATPRRPDGFYALATPGGDSYAFAVIDDKFVLATDAARASEFAAQSASEVPEAQGSLVMAMDTRAIANQVAERQGQRGASVFTGPLGDASGWIETSTSGMSGRFKQVIR